MSGRGKGGSAKGGPAKGGVDRGTVGKRTAGQGIAGRGSANDGRAKLGAGKATVASGASGKSTSGKGTTGKGTTGKGTAQRGGQARGDLKVRVRTAKGRTLASKLWLERQLNDPYVAAAKREGYRSRAAYKLLELDDRFHLLKPGLGVVDLGAAPGGWTQVAVARVNAKGDKPGPRGRVLGVDLTEVDPIAGATLMHLDFMSDDADKKVAAALNGRADVVLSDMASPATGHSATDHMRIIALCEAAADFAGTVLAPGGSFLAKVLRGGTERALLDRLKHAFTQVRHAKPPASRADSAEIYVVATGFRGRREE
jgi:23S rRNA (uridine2552-2'-O)-methyltransferase